MADAILTVKHLNKSYGHQPVLRDVSFECTQGRSWAWWARMALEKRQL
nr:hypothetical protein [Lactiplantibacillus plantarum]